MKKSFIFFILFLLIPFFVKAEVCDVDKISINSIEVEEKSNNTQELEKASVKGRSINFNLGMFEVGDMLRYKIVVNNDSNNDYELDENSFKIESDYIDYSFESEDNSNIVKANSSKTIHLKIEYKNEVPSEAFESGVYSADKKMLVNLSSNNSDTVKNPNTRVHFYIVVLAILFMISGTSVVILGKKKIVRAIVLIICLTVAIPVSYGLCKCDITIDSSVKIIKDNKIITYSKNNNDATGDMDFQVVEKNKDTTIMENTYVLDGFVFVEWNTKEDGTGDSYKAGDSISISDNITLYAIWRRSDTIYWALRDLDGNDINETLVLASHSEEGNIVGSFHEDTEFASSTEVPWINAAGWTEDNLSREVTNVVVENNIYPKSTAYWFYGVGYNATTFIADLYKLHTENVTNMSSMFVYSGRSATTWELNGIENFDTSKVTNMSSLFSSANCENCTELDLSNWDTSNVTNMSSMFSNFSCSSTTFTIKGLEDFDVSKVEKMDYMFSGFMEFKGNFDINLSRWNTSSLKSMKSMFDGAGQYGNRIYLDVSNWDISKVTSLHYVFNEFGMQAPNWGLKGLETWDTSKVTDMTRTFSHAGWKSRSFVLNLGGWNTSKVTDMYGMFDSAGYWATNWDVGDINSWDVSKVTNMGSMFTFAGGSENTFRLNLSSWNTSKVTKMYRMFEGTGNYSNYVYIDISGFDMSNVTNIERMFGAYSNSSYRTWEVTIPRTNGAEVENTTTVINGKDVSFDVTSDYGLNQNNVRFTLASN